MAEAFISLFKAECIHNPMMRPYGDWKSVADVEITVAEYIRPPYPLSHWARAPFGQLIGGVSDLA